MVLALAVPWLAYAGAVAARLQFEEASRPERDTQTLRVLLAMFVGTAAELVLAPFCVSGMGWVCVPLVIGSFAGCLALEADLDGIVGAMLAGIVDFAVGAVVALPVFIVVLVLGEGAGIRSGGVLPAVVVSSGVANLVFVSRMFKRAHRVRGEGGDQGELEDFQLEKKPDPPNETAAEQPPPSES
ncbi:MAG: hypothetical protein L6R28_17795 [Planctomycetes bacterium]|nr:hypothetical protein [Planctomycetota bacterium]